MAQEASAFASFIPDLSDRIRQSDNSIADEGFLKIDLMLTEEQNRDGSLVKPSPQRKALNLKGENEEDTGTLMEKKQKRMFGSFSAGKENVMPERNRISFARRERSSRTISHRKPFPVDLRAFGSLLNGGNEFQDVQAFWDAADEREASEAIMRKLRGGLAPEPKDVNATSTSRRRGFRRNNSQRRSARFKDFSAKMLSFADQIKSLDNEQLEEESETEFSSFTFSSDPLLELDSMHDSQTDKDKSNASRFSVMHGNNELLAAVEQNVVEGEKDDLARERSIPMDLCKSTEKPIEVTENIFPTLSEASVDVAQPSKIADNYVLSNPDVDDDLMTEVTPCYRNAISRRTSLTSPPPPPNPLESFSLRNDIAAVETTGKRRLELEFDDAMDPPRETSKHAAACLEIDCTLSSEMSPDCGTLRSGLVQVPSLDVAEEAEPIGANGLIPNEIQISPKVSKARNKKREAMLMNRRHSLEDAGTNWKDGVRRSTRIRSRPLEWWRGERFLLGRVHKSLTTVIGIKYSSPSQCWSKRNPKPSKFKVVSYVPDEHAKYVRFAALC